MTRAMPDDPSALMRSGEALLVAGDLGRAAQRFRRAIALAPRFGEAYLALSDTLIDERPEEAVAVLQRAKALDSRAWLILGMAQFQSGSGWDGSSSFDAGRLSEAAHSLRTATALVPTNAMGYWQLGDVHDTLGERRPALRALRAALQLAPTHVPAYSSLARVAGYEADSARGVRFARACYRAALRLAPAHAETLHNLATFHESQGEPERAPPPTRARSRRRPTSRSTRWASARACSASVASTRRRRRTPWPSASGRGRHERRRTRS